MTRDTARLLIIVFIVVETFAAMVIPAGQPHYRIRERIEAMKAYTLSPSPSTQAALDEEFARLHKHQKTEGIVLFPALLLVDAVVIYFFWNYGTRKNNAKQAFGAKC